ncbi:MAG TPA: phage major capsid protein [Acetobacteraceae bacterium]|nr:phage major capsid protein [Acetobacteraceae bacterium]
MARLNELRQQLGTTTDELETLIDNPRGFDRKVLEIEELKAKIARAEVAQAASAALANPADPGPGAEIAGAGGKRQAPKSKFKSLGEQLQAIVRASSPGGSIDQRLTRAPFGAGETDPSGGGFLVDVEFAETILTRAYDMGEILKRVFRLGISAGANGIKIPGIDETSRATGSRWGGVQAYWVAEGDQATATKPKFRLIELDLKKLMAIWYVTDELMADAAALTGIANQAFAEEITFMLEDSTVHGTGAGQPLGVLNSPCTVQVAKDKGQAAGTITWQNVMNMYAQMWGRSRKNAVWLINQLSEPQLFAMSQVVGTGGVAVFLPPGGASGAPYATLLGRPVVPVEYAEAAGTPGDIILADFSQYVMADKNAMQQMSSIHVRFLTDEMTFRLTYRCDGEPIWQAPLTPFKGTLPLSPFVTLAAR